MRQYHLAAAPGDVAEHVLLVGDPERAERAAARMQRVRFRAAHREYVVISGEHQGLDVSVVCVGMGAGSMEIAVVELCQITEQPTFIRAGSSGALQGDIALGDLVISQGALRLESASLGYVEAGFPALAHAEAQIALVRAAEERGAPFHVGITATAAGFYGAQARSVGPLSPRDASLLTRLSQQGVKNLEMEASCLLTLATLHGARAGCVCAIFANRVAGTFISPEAMGPAEERVVDVGLAALHHLARMARERGPRPLWHDGLAG
jgi:uridine phosphorylase